MEPIFFGKPQLCQEHPLQENSPGCLGLIVNLHSEPDSDFLEIWSSDHTALIYAAHVERGKYLQPPNETTYRLSTVIAYCHYIVYGLGKFGIHCTGTML